MVSQKEEMVIKKCLPAGGKINTKSRCNGYKDYIVEYEDENINETQVEPVRKHYDFKLLDEYFEFRPKKHEYKPIKMTPMTEEIFKLHRTETTVLEAMTEYIVNNVQKINASWNTENNCKNNKYSRKTTTTNNSSISTASDGDKVEIVTPISSLSDAESSNNSSSTKKLQFTRKIQSASSQHCDTLIDKPVEYYSRNKILDKTDVKDSDVESVQSSLPRKLRFHQKLIYSTPSEQRDTVQDSDVESVQSSLPTKLRFHRKFVNGISSQQRDIVHDSDVESVQSSLPTKLRFHRKFINSTSPQQRDTVQDSDIESLQSSFPTKLRFHRKFVNGTSSQQRDIVHDSDVESVQSSLPTKLRFLSTMIDSTPEQRRENINLSNESDTLSINNERNQNFQSTKLRFLRKANSDMPSDCSVSDQFIDEKSNATNSTLESNLVNQQNVVKKFTRKVIVNSPKKYVPTCSRSLQLKLKFFNMNT